MGISNVQQKVDQEKYGDNFNRIFRNKAIKPAVPLKDQDFLDPAKEWAKAIDNISEADPESAHGTADDLLLEFLTIQGYHEVVEAYNRLIDRCRWWSCA